MSFTFQATRFPATLRETMPRSDAMRSLSSRIDALEAAAAARQPTAAPAADADGGSMIARAAADGVMQLTAQRRAADPKLTEAEAQAQVFTEHPELYRLYRSGPNVTASVRSPITRADALAQIDRRVQDLRRANTALPEADAQSQVFASEPALYLASR
jgi:hypothetical protein